MRLSREGSLAAYAAVWLTGVLKVAGALLALALTEQWGSRVLPRRLLLVTGAVSSAVLILYGAGEIFVQLLVVGGVIDTPAGVNWKGFHGHLYLWDPWFAVWGLLLGLTTRAAVRNGRTDLVAQ